MKDRFKNFIKSIDLHTANLANKLLKKTNGVSTIFMRFISLLGDGGIFFMICGFVFLLFKNTRTVGSLTLWSLLYSLLITTVSLKFAVNRIRPFKNEDSRFYEYWVDAGSLNQGGYSFPSGHTTAATAFGVTLFLSFNMAYSWVFLFIPILMAFSRIYFMVHYLSDTLAGIFIGILSVLLGYYTYKLTLNIPIFYDFFITSVAKV